MTEPQHGPAGSRPSRLPLVLACVVSALVLGGALLAPLIARVAGYEREPADLSAVRTYDVTDRRHTEGGVDYEHTPPVGGPHAPTWLDCGVYDVPVREENAVHDLEHGTVWITHEPGMSEADLELLAEKLPDNGIMSPHEHLPTPVVVTVWGAQLALEGADDERLDMFLEEYGDGHTAPELGASCRGGTPDPSGGVADPGLGA